MNVFLVGEEPEEEPWALLPLDGTPRCRRRKLPPNHITIFLVHWLISWFDIG
jgi:hypothetical protein